MSDNLAQKNEKQSTITGQFITRQFPYSFWLKTKRQTS